jgi:hypothetical protein
MITDDLDESQENFVAPDTAFPEDVREHLERIKADYFERLDSRRKTEKFLITISYHLAGHTLGLFLLQYNLAVLQVFCLAWFVSAIPGFLELNGLRINKSDQLEIEGMDRALSALLKLASATIAAYFAVKDFQGIMQDSQRYFTVIEDQIHRYEVKPSTTTQPDMWGIAAMVIAVAIALNLFMRRR